MMTDIAGTHRVEGGDSAWRGPEIANDPNWKFELQPEHLEELEAAVAQMMDKGTHPVDVTRQDFPLPTLGSVLERIAEDIDRGRGFALIRGLPVERLGFDHATMAFAGISSHLGRLVSQNCKGDRMVSIRATGEAHYEGNVRAPSTNAELFFHSDFSDIVGLLCLHPAKEGGISRIASSIAIHDALVKAGRADLLDVLHSGFPFDRKEEQLPELPPILETPLPMLRRQNGRLHFRFVPGWSVAAAKRSGEALDPIRREAIDTVNQLARQREFFLDMKFRVGDIQYLNNYTVLHSRTAFVDFEEPERRRFLQRVWLRAHRAEKLDPEFDRMFHPDVPGRNGIPAWDDLRA